MFPYVEIAPKSEGATAIANIEGKKLRTPVLTVVESLPLSNKSEAAIPILEIIIGRIKEEKENIK